MYVNDMTKQDFDNLIGTLHVANWQEKIRCWSFVILPTSDIHDSGYACMYYVAFDDKGEPICLIGGASDVLHIEGIGGFGFNWYKNAQAVPQLIKPSGWCIDCLPKSNLLRFFCDGQIIFGNALSSVEVFRLSKGE